MSLIFPVHPLFGRGGAAPLNVADLFSTDLYTGTSSTQTITNGIDLSGRGGLVWLKARESLNSPYTNLEIHCLFDNIRSGASGGGAGGGGRLRTDSNQGEQNDTYLDSYNSDGFSIVSAATVAASDIVNQSGKSFVAWTFRRSPRFFDVVTYTGNGTAGRTISHNLGVPPGMIMVKRRDSLANWAVYHRSNTAAPETDYLLLNNTGGTTDDIQYWNDTAPTDSVFSVGNSTVVNANTNTYVAYLFAHDTASDGVIQCGSYTGNGSATGPVITLGWEPQWGMIKRSDSTGDWWIYDDARDASNPRTFKLLANSSAAEDTAGEDVDFISTGFQPKTTATGINASGGTYVYAFIRKEGV